MAIPYAITKRFTVDEYYKIFEAGVFEGERVELIEGEVVRMCSQNIPHALTITLLNEPFVTWFKPCMVRVQLPFQVGNDSEPEPDFAIVTREQLLSPERHPTGAELIVEVADSSLAYDRMVKGRLYAAAGVPEYWIINLPDARVEIYRDPRAELYASTRILESDESFQPLRFPGVTVQASELLQASRPHTGQR
jgi:Uma2 family endonuclease